MSSLMDGLSNIYSLTSQINSLKDQATRTKSNTNGTDPENALLNLQQNFNEMLNSLIVSSDQDKDKDKEGSDPFAFLTDYQNSLYNLTNQTSQSNTTNNSSLNINSYTGSIDDNPSQNTLPYDPLLTQYKLNLDNIF